MPPAARVYDLFGALLTYPGEDYLALADECHRLLAAADPAAAADVAVFAGRLRELDVDGLRELFTITFDLNPVSSPEVGWHLHGETYERGEFMVRMRSLLRDHGVAETGELPDHLCYLVAAVPRLERDERAALITEALVPAIQKMLEPLARLRNPYEPLLNAVKQVLDAQVAALPAE